MSALPTAESALAAASGYQSSLNSSARKASSYASDIAGTAGTLSNQADSLWDIFSDDYSGLIGNLADDAEIPLSSYVNNAANDVGSQYNVARGIQQRDMARMGVNPNSGRWQGMQESMARAEAAARAGAMTSARFTGQQANWNRSLQAANVGTQLAGMSQNALGSAMSGYGQAAGIQSNLAGIYGQQAGAAGQYAGYRSGLDNTGGTGLATTTQNTVNQYAHRSPSAAEGQAARAASAGTSALSAAANAGNQGFTDDEMNRINQTYGYNW